MEKYVSNEVIERIKSNYPAMIDIIDFEGTIDDYYNNLKAPLRAPSNSRRNLLIDSIMQGMKNSFNSEDQSILKNGLQKNYLVSTAEHHASISHPETLNVLINQFLIQKKLDAPIISLSCSTTTLDNELFPRGVFFKGQKIPFLTSKFKSHFASNAPSIDSNSFNRKILSLFNEGYLKKDDFLFLKKFSANTLDTLLSDKDFSEQISQLNYYLWSEMISEDLKSDNSKLFMLSSEIITANILYLDLRSENTGWVFKSLFDRRKRESIYYGLNKTRLCWDIEENKGTFLFWKYSDNGKAERLFLEGDFLKNDSREYSLLFSPDSIFNALSKRIIVPASNLFFLYSVFYCGVNVLGGILQVNYLGEIKEKLLELKSELELNNEDIKIIKDLKTNLYVNFQTMDLTSSGLNVLNNKIDKCRLDEYSQKNHFKYIQECLEFLDSIN